MCLVQIIFEHSSVLVLYCSRYSLYSVADMKDTTLNMTIFVHLLLSFCVIYTVTLEPTGLLTLILDNLLSPYQITIIHGTLYRVL